MKENSELKKLDQTTLKAINKIKDFLENETIKFHVEDNNFYLESIKDFNEIKKELEKLKNNLDLEELKTYEILDFFYNFIIIDLWYDRFIKIIYERNLIKKFRSIIYNILWK